MKKVTVNLTDKAHQIIINHKIKMQRESTNNLNFTDALNDFVENKK